MPNIDGNPEAGPVTDEDLVASLLEPDGEEEEADEEETLEASEDADGEDDAEAEDADADDDADDDAEEESDEPEEESKFIVKVDGEEFEVTQAELVAGYQKGADYHRKTAALAEERRSFQAQSQAEQQQMRSQYAAALEKVLAQDAPENEPNWVELSESLDPWEYQQAQAKWHQKVQTRQQARAQADSIRTQSHQMIVAQETQKLMESFPEWKTVEAFEKDRGELLATAMEAGFTLEEFNSAVDHRVFKLVKKAAKWDKYQAALSKPAKKIPKKASRVLTPGASVTKSERKAANATSLRDNLRRKGDEDSAVAYLLGGR